VSRKGQTSDCAWPECRLYTPLFIVKKVHWLVCPANGRSGGAYQHNQAVNHAKVIILSAKIQNID
jgi:hypothetical protein